jgi:hypothetical protein
MDKAASVEGVSGEATDPLNIECPRCNAPAGSRCHEAAFGEYKFTHHNARIAAANTSTPSQGRGTRLRNKTTGDLATVIYDDGQEVTILVDGYAASDAYDATELAEKWEVVP